MKGNVSALELVEPRSLEHALRLLRDDAPLTPLAGCTDLYVLLNFGTLAERRFLNLWKLNALRRIELRGDVLAIGALATYSQLIRSRHVRQRLPMLIHAAREIGGMQIQNRGTIGGNIANASPAADSPPALLCYDAEVEVVSSKGARWVPYATFHKGYKQMDLAPNELLRRVRLPRRAADARVVQHYRKVGTRKAQAISKVCFAAALSMEGERIADLRLALGSVAPMPLRCHRTESLLRGAPITPEQVVAARGELAREMAPIDDFRSSARYRSRVAQDLLADFLAGGAGSPAATVA